MPMDISGLVVAGWIAELVPFKIDEEVVSEFLQTYQQLFKGYC